MLIVKKISLRAVTNRFIRASSIIIPLIKITLKYGNTNIEIVIYDLDEGNQNATTKLTKHKGCTK